MPAHLTMITQPKCQWGSCRKEARRLLRDTFNTDLGTYCDAHATTALNAQREREKDPLAYQASVGRLQL